MQKRRPVTRSFWPFLRYMPSFIRAPFLRSKFEVAYDLPEELVLKQAETESEIKQALTLVHDSYVELGYMDEHESRMRFSKFLALPTTVILIAKWNDEVVGTISIVSDSALGLPTDEVWNRHEFRKKGEIVAEISALSIKKNFSFRRGKLLMALCKIMYLYCRDILRVDCIVAATTTEVEPFYTDILLFDSLCENRGDSHQGVKGNPSFYGCLPMKEIPKRYKRVYNKFKDPQKNLYLYFCKAESKWIQLPSIKTSLQSYFKNKTKAINDLIQNHEILLQNFDEKDIRVIQNLDAAVSLQALRKTEFIKKSRTRFEVRTPGVVFLNGATIPEPCRVMNISDNGLQILLEKPQNHLLTGQSVLIVFEYNQEWITCQGTIRWLESQKRLGCSVTEENSHSWKKFVNLVWHDVDMTVPLPARTRKVS